MHHHYIHLALSFSHPEFLASFRPVLANLAIKAQRAMSPRATDENEPINNLFYLDFSLSDVKIRVFYKTYSPFTRYPLEYILINIS